MCAIAEDMRRISYEKDNMIAALQRQVVQLDLRCQFLEMAGHNGVLLWKISSIQQRISDSQERRVISLYSQPFYAGRYGYKLCARVYFNGDGDGYGTHVSLFFVVMQASNFLLSWTVICFRYITTKIVVSNSVFLQPV